MVVVVLLLLRRVALREATTKKEDEAVDVGKARDAVERAVRAGRKTG